MTRAVTLANLAVQDLLTLDSDNSRAGIGSTQPTTALDVDGTVTATSFVGNGANLTGVSGFADAISNDVSSPLNKFFTTPKTVQIGAGTSVTIESSASAGNVAFVREGIVHVATGATFHVKTNTTLVTNVLGVF